MGKFIVKGMLSVCATLGLLLGCNLPQVPPEKRDGRFPVDNAVTVRYLIPKSANVLNSDGPGKGVWFEVYSRLPDGTYTQTQFVGNILVSRAERSQPSAIIRGQTISSYGEYKIEVATAEANGNIVVSLTPKTINRFSHSAVPMMQFTQAALRDAVLYRGFISVKYEFDSTYSAEATLANFRRAGAEYEKEGQQDKKRLVLSLKKDGYEASATVEVWPYKTGSKAVLKCAIVGIADPVTYTVDFGKAIPVIGKELERITNG